MTVLKSLRFRIGLASIIAIVSALVIANTVITGLFSQYATKQFELNLKNQFIQLAGLVSVNPKTQRVQLISPTGEPKWAIPLSGLYWQINLPNGEQIRSRSLWDESLKVQEDHITNKGNYSKVDSFGKQKLLAYSQSLAIKEEGVSEFILTVATDATSLDEAIALFASETRRYLMILAVCLLVILAMQLTIGLKPLSQLKRAIIDLKMGKSTKIEGGYPSEFDPLVTNFNLVLEQNQQIVERARAQAGNLAHAVKTPITVIQNAARSEKLTSSEFKDLVLSQTKTALDQVEWNLAKARINALSKLTSSKVPVLEVIHSIVRVMNKLYEDKNLSIHVQTDSRDLLFNGDSQDLQEIVGNLLDNACKWARSTVRVNVSLKGQEIKISVEDDGIGLDPNKYESALKRGAKLDEITPGSGLGLSIVNDLILLYGGSIELAQSKLGGLEVSINL